LTPKEDFLSRGGILGGGGEGEAPSDRMKRVKTKKTIK